LQRSRAFQKRPLSSRATCGRLREAKGLSQGALAADAAIYQDLVSRIENGAANPELDTLGKIAAALGCIRASCWTNEKRGRQVGGLHVYAKSITSSAQILWSWLDDPEGSETG
jgi:transcriptional regulator with XRE-family HTH domain